MGSKILLAPDFPAFGPWYLQVLHGSCKQVFLSLLFSDVVSCQSEKKKSAFCDILPEAWNVYHRKSCVEGLDQDDTEDRAAHVADTADEGYTAEDNSCDRIKLEVDVCGRLSGVIRAANMMPPIEQRIPIIT